MKIGFASRWDPSDRGSWSGSIHYMYEEIRRNFKTEIFHFKWNRWIREWLTTRKSFNRIVHKKATAVEFLDAYARYFSAKLTRALRERPVDCLFVPGSSQLVAYVETDTPIIYQTDATFYQLQGYYPGFSNLSHSNVKEGVLFDRRAFLKAAHCMLASDWARLSAIEDYGVDGQKISVVPFGPNMDDEPAKELLTFNARPGCRLLFLGVDWQRKGGDIALAAFRRLRAMHTGATLRIVGCVPPHDLSAERDITVIPFIDKNDPQQRKMLEEVFLDTDLLFLPTRAECAGIVFSEAAAYGVPSITTDTGGVSTYVKNGINGFTLPLSAGAEDYASLISSLVSSAVSLKELKAQSREFYERHLSWRQWSKAFCDTVVNVSGKSLPAM